MLDAQRGGFFAPEVALAGKAAVVTGSSRGIGRAVALELARRGCDVLVNCQASRAAADAVADEIRAMGRRAVVVQADIAERASHARIVGAAREAFGGIDILVNNAATLRVVDVLDEDEASFDAVLRTNLNATHFLTQRVARAMIERGAGGCIVYALSINATLASDNRPSYCVSKAALQMSMRLYAGRLAEHGIKVNGVEIAITDTEFVRARIPDYLDAARKGYISMVRPATPQDMALAVVSAITLFDTGALVPAGGGIMARLLNLRQMSELESRKGRNA